jgi:hypothetical protein
MLPFKLCIFPTSSIPSKAGAVFTHVQLILAPGAVVIVSKDFIYKCVWLAGMWIDCNYAVLSTVLKYRNVFTVALKLFPKIRCAFTFVWSLYRPCENGMFCIVRN